MSFSLIKIAFFYTYIAVFISYSPTARPSPSSSSSSSSSSLLGICQHSFLILSTCNLYLELGLFWTLFLGASHRQVASGGDDDYDDGGGVCLSTIVDCPNLSLSLSLSCAFI